MMTRIKRIPLICSLFLGLFAGVADSLLSKQSLAARQALQQVGMAGDKYRGRCTAVLLEGGAENANKGIDFESVLGESSEPVVVTEGRPSSSFSDHCGGAVVMVVGGEDEAKQKERISKLRSR